MATPVRHVRIPDELWAAAKEKAWRERTTVGATVNALLAAWVADAPAEPGRLDTGRPGARDAIRGLPPMRT